MNRTIVIFIAAVLAANAGAQEQHRAGENPRAVLPSGRRVDTLKKADALLEVRPAGSAALVENLLDPFYPLSRRSGKDKPDEPKNPLADFTDAQLLARAAAGIQPTGTMLIGDEPYLLLGGRRYKSGDQISVNIDGLAIQVVVLSIQRNSYTLRLREEELRRDFK